MRAGLSGDGVRGRKLWALCFALLVSPARLGLAAAGDGWPHEQVGRSRSSVLFCFSSIHVRVRSRGCAIRGRACLAHLPASGQQPSTAGADPAPAITYAVVRKGERVPQGVTTCFQGRASGDEGHYSGGPRWLRVGGLCLPCGQQWLVHCGGGRVPALSMATLWLPWRSGRHHTGGISGDLNSLGSYEWDQAQAGSAAGSGK